MTSLTFHFGFNLLGRSAQIQYYDGATTHDILIPAGVYYFRHDTAAKDIRSVITTLINTSLGGGSFSFTTNNDRQLEWNMDGAGDYINLVNTGDMDDLKLAAALGAYDNSGDLTYFRSNNITDGYVTPNVLSSWFASGGYVHDTYDLTGADVAQCEVYETAGSSLSYSAGPHKAELGAVDFTGIEGNGVRGGWPYATQATPGTTINADWTTSIWRASDPEINTPHFYAEIVDSSTLKYEYALRSKIERSDVRQLQPGWTAHFNMRLNLLLVEDLT